MNSEINERKQKILKAIIKDYQHTAEPAGSRIISKKYLPNLSPATIRNEMTELEEAGLIMQMHTSSGRVPTDKGYRFYVDHLMKALRPTNKEETMIKQSFAIKSNLDQILHQTAKLLSHTLDYTVIVVNISSQHKIFSAGTSSLLHQPEFRNINQMQKILELLEEEELLTEIVEEYTLPQEVNIKIGSENNHKEIRECSVVISSYEIDEKPIGSIGIIGPTRMYYSKVASLVDYVAKELSNVFATGEFL